MRGLRTVFSAAVLASASACLGGCITELPGAGANSAVAPVKTAAAERECLIRAMYFESNRTSQEGLMAVGTVVMNRVKSGQYPDTICGVVSEPGQFAANVMTASLSPAELPPVERAADAVLAGKRYKPVGDAMYFHNASIKIPYPVHYLTVAGGNAFYEKVAGHRGTELASAAPAPAPSAHQAHDAAPTAAAAPNPAPQPAAPAPSANASSGATAPAPSAAAPMPAPTLVSEQVGFAGANETVMAKSSAPSFGFLPAPSPPK